MSGRKLLAEALKTALPTWQVVSHAAAIDTVRRPGALVMWTQKRNRLEKLGFDWLKDEVTLWVLSGADALHVEDDLDELLQQVLEALEPLESFTWSEAERGTLLDTFDGWRITVTCTYQINNELGEEE